MFFSSDLAASNINDTDLEGTFSLTLVVYKTWKLDFIFFTLSFFPFQTTYLPTWNQLFQTGIPGSVFWQKHIKDRINRMNRKKKHGAICAMLAMLLWLVVEPTHLKNMIVKLDHFPNFRGENKKYLKPPPSTFSCIDSKRDQYMLGVAPPWPQW